MRHAPARPDIVIETTGGGHRCPLKHIESIVLFVPDIGRAAAWYAGIFGVDVEWENPDFAFIQTNDARIGFHPADSKCPGGVGGTTAYWEVESIGEAVDFLTLRGASLHRGPAVTRFGAGAAMLVDPFGCTIGLNASSPESRARLSAAAAPTRLSAESVVEFLHHFEAVAMQEDFRLLQDMIDEHAFFRFNDGDFVGRAAIQAAFEKSWRGDPSVRKARFYLSDIVVLSTDQASATATYTFHWEGSQGDRAFEIQGRGTRVLRHDNGRFRIVHEHLSRFPPVQASAPGIP
jgi:predicted enzyme related to lactoylglutathione lyase/ketosteroid isomerase-like protein